MSDVKSPLELGVVLSCSDSVITMQLGRFKVVL